MGIVAFSLACLRPLFRNMYQHSTHLGSFPTANGGPGSAPQPRHASGESQNGLRGPPLPINFAKSIHVTTAIDAYSSEGMSSDVEAGIGGHSRVESEITNTPIEDDGWNKGLSGDKIFEMGRITPGFEGVSVDDKPARLINASWLANR